MFYRKGRTAGYISVIHFRLERFLFDHFVYFLRRNFKVLGYKVSLGESCWINTTCFQTQKIIVSIILITILTKIIVIMIFPIIERPYCTSLSYHYYTILLESILPVWHLLIFSSERLVREREILEERAENRMEIMKTLVSKTSCLSATNEVLSVCATSCLSLPSSVTKVLW